MIMKKLSICFTLFFAMILLAGYAVNAQSKLSDRTAGKEMKTYLIERDIPNAGKLTKDELKGISKTSCNVLKEMGPDIQWIQSYVTDEKIYCVYKAENEDLIREHAKKGGFPANSIMEIGSVISPATAQ
jgi:Protein of unknown function (DUF4242)